MVYHNRLFIAQWLWLIYLRLPSIKNLHYLLYMLPLCLLILKVLLWHSSRITSDAMNGAQLQSCENIICGYWSKWDVRIKKKNRTITHRSCKLKVNTRKKNLEPYTACPDRTDMSYVALIWICISRARTTTSFLERRKLLNNSKISQNEKIRISLCKVMELERA